MSLNLFQHLLPKGRAFLLTAEKNIRRFFEGLAIENGTIKTFIDQVWEDIDPQRTRELEAWEEQWSLWTPTPLTDQERRDRLESAWKATGGQSPSYLQGVLQGAGFDVYVHEWWEPTPTPPPYVARDPGAVGASYFIQGGADVSTEPYEVMQCGETLAQCGETEMLCGNTVGFTQITTYPPAPSNSAFFPYFLYIGGQTFGTDANVDSDRRAEFEFLCRKYAPAQQWIGFFINYI